MDERRDDLPPELPAGRVTWRRFVATPRAAAGVGLVVATVALWLLSGFSWIPLLAGVAVLVVVRIMRLDGLLRGWDLHLAGVVVVIGLLWSTSPWAWGLAAGAALLVVGLARWPQWQLAAAGLALCVGSGIGLGFAQVQEQRTAEETFRSAQAETYAVEGELVPYRVVGALLEGIVQNDPVGVCGLLGERAREQFALAAAAPDCAAATTAFHRAVATGPPPFEGITVTMERGGAAEIVNGCSTAWAQPPLGGRSLGRIVLEETTAAQYYGARFLPC